jgi:uncharacterized protein (TIGR03067 family)
MKVGKLSFLLAALLAADSGLAMAAKVPRQNNAIPAELRGLQGTWNLVETDVQGQSIKPRFPTQWIFVGNKLFLRSGNRTVPQGYVDLNSSQKPRAITLVVQGKPSILGIYELRGQKLQICASADERPSLFVADGSNVVTVLEKATAPHVGRRGRM